MIAFFQDPLVPRQAGDLFGNVEAIHEVGLAALGVLSVLALSLPRRFLGLPLVAALCFVPAGQRAIVFTLDLSFLRILMVVFWVRLVLRQELRPLVWNNLDRVFLAWNAVCLFTAILLFGTVDKFINRAGYAADALLLYFFFRQVVRDREDLLRFAAQFGVASFAVLPFFLYEQRTGTNAFFVFGGVPEITEVRDGRLRCQGAFAHPIIAGCFWALLIPLYGLRGLIRGRWLLAALSIGTAIALVVLCASSTPVVAVGLGFVGVCAWYVRGALRWFRWLALFSLVAMHLLMSQPVWHLVSRIDLVGGSTGWHRFHLVDRFIAMFGEWAAFGTIRTGHWGTGLHDVTNMIVAEGTNGGIVRLGLFLAMIWLGFAGVSRSMRSPAVSKEHRYVAWALGVVLFVHTMNFIAVSYFEQAYAIWYLTLAGLASLTLVPGARPASQLASTHAGESGKEALADALPATAGGSVLHADPPTS